MDTTEKLIQALQMVQGEKHTWGVGPTAQTLAGAGGIWNDPGLMQPVISLVPLPEGLLRHLNSYMTDTDVEKYSYISGFNAPADRHVTAGLTECGPCQTVGMEKNCFQKAPWGYKCLDSRQLKLLNYGHRYQRTDPMDLYIENTPTIAQGMGAPGPSEGGRRNVLDPIEQQYDLIGREFMWWFNRQMLWYGNPAANVINNNNMVYGEPYGLQLLIATGHVDERDGVTTCPTLDSQVWAWPGGNIAANPNLFLNLLAGNIGAIWKRARDANMQMDPARDWALVMRYDAFFAITRIWPCVYSTYFCAPQPGGAAAQVNANQYGSPRPEDMLNPDYMFSNRILWIQGVPVPVVIDDAINETDNGDGTFTSDIFYVPLRYLGNRPATYLEFFDYSGTEPMKAAYALAQQLGVPNWKISDGGRFLWMTENQWACAIIKAMTMPRVILRTPHLAMQANSVTYSVTVHSDDSWDDQPYHRSCGVYEVDLPTNYGPFGDVLTHYPGGGVQVTG